MTKFLCIFLFLSTVHAESLYDKSRDPMEGMSYGTPADIKKNQDFFDKLIGFAVETKSSAVLLIKDDKVLLERYWDVEPDEAIHLHSITKSILSLAVGKLSDDGRLSLSDPAKKWFRDWTGDKEGITVQNLMNQTSGYPDSRKEVFKGPNRLKLAIAEKTVSPPGGQFAYSNMGAWLVGEIVHQAAKKDPDQYTAENFFSPMGIQKWKWEKDGTQNVDTSSGLSLNARDLAKFGQLMLGRGMWKRDRLISEKYVESATQSDASSAKEYGLLWWVNGDNYYARGDMGQILAIYPKSGVILVRLKKSEVRDHMEGSSQAWESRAKQLGRQLKK